MRIAVVGAGRWSAAVHLPALASDPHVHLVGIVDSDTERARDVGRLFGITATDDLASLGEVDGVVVATSHDSHAQIARPLLERGIDVLVEKPLTLDPTSAWELVDAARSSGARLHTGYTFLHSRSVALLRRSVAEGRLGRLRLVSGDFATAAGRLYGEQTNAIAGEPVAPLAGTYADPARGGGQLFAQATHAVSLVLDVMAEPARDVSARFVHAHLGVDLVDALTIGFDDAVAVLTSTGTVRARQHAVEHYRFYGEDGHAELNTRNGRLQFVDYDSGDVEVLDLRADEEANPVGAPAHELVSAWRERRPPKVDGVMGAQTVDILHAAAVSARTSSREMIVHRTEKDGD